MHLISLLTASCALLGAAQGQSGSSGQSAPASPASAPASSSSGSSTSKQITKDVPTAPMVIEPASASGRSLDYVMANFGTIPYGHKIQCAPCHGCDSPLPTDLLATIGAAQIASRAAQALALSVDTREVTVQLRWQACARPTANRIHTMRAPDLSMSGSRPANDVSTPLSPSIVHATETPFASRAHAHWSPVKRQCSPVTRPSSNL
jgi:hypothetical protein